MVSFSGYCNGNSNGNGRQEDLWHQKQNVTKPILLVNYRPSHRGLMSSATRRRPVNEKSQISAPILILIRPMKYIFLPFHSVTTVTAIECSCKTLSSFFIDSILSPVKIRDKTFWFHFSDFCTRPCLTCPTNASFVVVVVVVVDVAAFDVGFDAVVVVAFVYLPYIQSTWTFLS